MDVGKRSQMLVEYCHPEPAKDLRGAVSIGLRDPSTRLRVTGFLAQARVRSGWLNFSARQGCCHPEPAKDLRGAESIGLRDPSTKLRVAEFLRD
jgi:hypothetical protein